MAENAKKRITFIVVTPYKNFYEGKMDSVVIPSLDGEMGILAGHSPLVAALTPGICTVRVDDELKHFVISEGYSEIGQNFCLVVCNAAEWPEDLDVEMALESYQKFKLELAKEDVSNRDKGDIEFSLKRAKARLHTIELYGSIPQKSKLDELKELYSY